MSLDLLIDLHQGTDRQGPGTTADTLRALDLCDLPRDKDLRIADIGCGTGGQTLTLARHLRGSITAVDLFPTFLDALRTRSAEAGLDERITPLLADMSDLPFEAASLDLIWSEGAIYNMGFRAGVREWKRFLRPGGVLAVSEITWTTARRPAAIEDHWVAAYPEIDTASAKIRVLEEEGYTPLGYFALSPAAWAGYYNDIRTRGEAFLDRHGRSAAARAVLDEMTTEQHLFDRYGSFFSYGFYVARSGQANGPGSVH